MLVEAFGIVAATSLYALLIHSWPFAAVEAVWTLVAIRRWAGLRVTRSEARQRR
jgi:hypothetical protein